MQRRHRMDKSENSQVFTRGMTAFDMYITISVYLRMSVNPPVMRMIKPNISDLIQ